MHRGAAARVLTLGGAVDLLERARGIDRREVQRSIVAAEAQILGRDRVESAGQVAIAIDGGAHERTPRIATKSARARQRCAAAL